MTSARIEAHFTDDPPELIIGHNGLAEVITFKTGIDVLPWIPEYEIAGDQLYRIACGVEAFEIEALLGRPLKTPGKRLKLDYLLLLESDWQEFVTQVRTQGTDEELLERIDQWKNPAQVRPAYLLRK